VSVAERIKERAGRPAGVEARRGLLSVREFGIFCAALSIFLLLWILTPEFRSSSNLLNVVRQVSLMGIIATGMTFLFIAGELDLSVGTMYGFLAMIMAELSIANGWSPWLAAPVTVLLGSVFGWFNGFMVTRFKIPAFIITLGMLSVFRGATLVLSNGYPISGLQAPAFRQLTAGYIGGVLPVQILWLAVVMLVGGFALASTRFGYHVYATGGNATAAANVGIRTNRIKIACFVLTGALAGLAAALLVGWLRGASPLTGQGFELDVIAAVIIGGTNLFGGSGSVVGTFLGAVIIGMIANGLVLLGVSAFWEPIAKGAIIVAAVLLDILIRKRRNSTA
jgi:ribose transport system permease protein